MEKIKKLTRKDIPEALKIVLETGASCSKKEAKKIMELSLAPGIKFLNPDYYLLFLDNEIIGIYGLYYDYEDPKDVMWMDYFAVKPAFQKQGYGTKMLENLENFCRNKKIRILCVFTDNDNALNFYKNHGFNVSGKIDDYYEKSKHRTWLYKTLT